MRVSRKKIARIVLLVVVLASAFLLADATTKYVGFYDALANFKTQLLGVDFTSTQEILNVTMTLRVFNPTGYGDMKLSDIVGTVYYEGENHTVVTSAGGPRSGNPYQQIVTPWWLLPESRIFVDQKLPPYSTTFVTINLTAKGDDAKIFNTYYEKDSPQLQTIHWQLNFRVTVETPVYLQTMDLQYQFTW